MFRDERNFFDVREQISFDQKPTDVFSDRGKRKNALCSHTASLLEHLVSHISPTFWKPLQEIEDVLETGKLLNVMPFFQKKWCVKRMRRLCPITFPVATVVRSRLVEVS